MSAVPTLKPAKTPAIDREAVANVIRAMLAVGDAKVRLSARLAEAEKRQAEHARALSAMVGSLSGFVIDGYSVALHVVEGRAPIVNIRPVAVL